MPKGPVRSIRGNGGLKSPPNHRQNQGETLNFESPGAFFGRLTERRWALLTALQGQGAMAVRQLARRAGRDVKRLHEDVPAPGQRTVVTGSFLASRLIEIAAEPTAN